MAELAELVGLKSEVDFGKLSAMLHEHIFLLAEALKNGASTPLKALKHGNQELSLDTVTKEVICTLVAKNFFLDKKLKVDGRDADNTVVLSKHPLIYRGIIVAIMQISTELLELNVNERQTKQSVARVVADINKQAKKAIQPEDEQPSLGSMTLNILDGDSCDGETTPVCTDEISANKDEEDVPSSAKKAKIDENKDDKATSCD